MAKLMQITDDGCRAIQGKRMTILKFWIQTNAKVNQEIEMCCLPNYKDAVLKALRRLISIEMIK